MIEHDRSFRIDPPRKAGGCSRYYFSNKHTFQHMWSLFLYLVFFVSAVNISGSWKEIIVLYIFIPMIVIQLSYSIYLYNNKPIVINRDGLHYPYICIVRGRFLKEYKTIPVRDITGTDICYYGGGDLIVSYIKANKKRKVWFCNVDVYKIGVDIEKHMAAENEIEEDS